MSSRAEDCVCGNEKPNPERKIRVGNVIGKAVKRIEPIYPRRAKRQQIEGQVVVEVFIDDSGCVRWAQAIGGPAELRESAVAAACRFSFYPTEFEGSPVWVDGVLVFPFKLTRTARAAKARPN